MADPKAYKIDVTDAQWQRFYPLFKQFDPEFTKGPDRTADLREIDNTIVYQQRTGCQGDLLPHDLTPKSNVHDTYKRWRTYDVLRKVNEAMVAQVSTAEVDGLGQPCQEKPSAASFDSQTTKSTQACEDRDYDGGKKIAGRKRHVAVDILGLLLAVFVSVASVDDAPGAQFLVDQLERESQPRLKMGSPTTAAWTDTWLVRTSASRSR